MSRTKALLAVVVGVLTAFFWAVPAQAHNSFTGSDPKNGARIATAPDTVTLRFLATLDPASTKVVVTGPDGIEATDGAPTVKANKATIGVRDAGGGAYTVTFQVSSKDGHPVKGTVTFTVIAAPKPAATPSATTAPTPEGGAAGPISETPVTTGPAAVGLDPVPDESDGGTPWLTWTIGAVVLIGATAAGTWLIRRRAAA